MPSKTSFFIEIDLHQAITFRKLVPRRLREIHRVAAKRYLQYLKNRFISLSGRSGGYKTWKELSTFTVKRKQRRGIAKNPHWILRESDTLLMSMSYELRQEGFIVGFINTGKHPYSKLTVAQLAEVHQRGNPHLPRRPIIVEPNLETMRKMVYAITKKFGDVIKEAEI